MSQVRIIFIHLFGIRSLTLFSLIWTLLAVKSDSWCLWVGHSEPIIRAHLQSVCEQQRPHNHPRLLITLSSLTESALANINRNVHSPKEWVRWNADGRHRVMLEASKSAESRWNNSRPVILFTCTCMMEPCFISCDSCSRMIWSFLVSRLGFP